MPAHSAIENIGIQIKSIVDAAIAIIIQTIAGFRDRQHLSSAHTPSARNARLRAAMAKSHAIGAYRARIAGLLQRIVGCVLVDSAVAVLVQPIADFHPAIRDRAGIFATIRQQAIEIVIPRLARELAVAARAPNRRHMRGCMIGTAIAARTAIERVRQFVEAFVNGVVAVIIYTVTCFHAAVGDHAVIYTPGVPGTVS
jgi:hypothetical protein